MTEIDKEVRAYALLQWGSPAPLADFDEELAVQGFYTKAQRERSDAAVMAFDKQHEGTKPETELMKFRHLQAWGALTHADFFSPEKADNSVYHHEYKFQQHQRQLQQLNGVAKGLAVPAESRHCSHDDVSGGGVAASNEEPSGKSEFGLRRSGRRFNRGNRPSQ
jgi:hypothetical protein